MLQNVLRANIQGKLNTNTAYYTESPSNNIRFVLGQFYHNDTEDEYNNRDFIYTIENGYKTIDATYVPCSMRFQSEYTPLLGTKTGRSTIPIDFFICIEDADADNRIEATNQIVTSVVGNAEDVVDGATTYHTVWNMSAITDAGQIYYFNGKKYIILQTTIYIEFSDTFHYGNEWSITFDEHEINFISFKSELGGEEDLPQLLGSAEAKGGIKTNARTFSMTCYVDDYMSGIIDGWEASFNQDAVHQIAYVSPTNAAVIDLSVVIKDRVYSLEKGEKVSVTIVFVISDIAYVEPTFSITYYLDGGANNESNPPSFDDDDVPVALNGATKAYYTFNGWYTEAEFVNSILTIATLANTSIYAKFTPIDYDITYELDGGANDEANPASFDIEDLPFALLSPTREGYTFFGWYLDAELTDPLADNTITTVGNKTVYAKWVLA